MSNKKILLLVPKTYDYHNVIRQYLEKMFGYVEVILENTNGIVIGSIKKVKPLNKILFAHYNKKVTEIINKEQFDVIFIIRGYYLTTNTLRNIKKHHPKVKIIMYQWDSIQNMNYLPLIRYCDEVYSFDQRDCKEYKINYLPLFYINLISKTEIKNKYDILFVGLYHSNRQEVLLKIREYVEKNNIKYYFYLYLPLFSYLKKKWILKENVKRDFLHYRTLSYKRYLHLLDRCNAVVDIPHKNQTGLTIRTIETLGNGKNILTTNGCIVEEEFFNSRCIKVLDPNDPVFDLSYLKPSNVTIEKGILHISEWLERIIK